MNGLKCVICGMNINDKNYNLNNYAFFNTNSKEEILYCPFCGAGKKYLIEEESIEIRNILLDEYTKKVLENAMKLETFNGDFYSEAAQMAKDERTSKIFRDLSKIEYMHARVHKSLGGFKESPKLIKVDYSKYNNDELLFKLAKQKEEHAVAFYNKYYSNVCSDYIREIFEALIEVEEEHIELTSF
ncbi:rubrerythrin [Clostridium homopropionicum DSM 5847]|uniref:Rubrerythrin n=1 Tax=Clostridium homopropionicum DSM 5847 TaxID=1121318 RepID=A0A0L6ZEJ1_9CLOT|nr:ferritin family protein [Clostridium homopropionicum]KOA21372.1 rubrerythrin [Clostridium homopropionicum DSM 5847]SFG12029.1 Rubrerythrin [Clostridium homopropionicum]